MWLTENHVDKYDKNKNESNLIDHDVCERLDLVT